MGHLAELERDHDQTHFDQDGSLAPTPIFPLLKPEVYISVPEDCLGVTRTL